ncbi:MAG: hypothetical protein FWE45_02725 [Firmicutes bacterium]|nr:hypothetical protein [Bacillota bacterium]
MEKDYEIPEWISVHQFECFKFMIELENRGKDVELEKLRAINEYINIEAPENPGLAKYIDKQRFKDGDILGGKVMMARFGIQKVAATKDVKTGLYDLYPAGGGGLCAGGIALHVHIPETSVRVVEC